MSLILEKYRYIKYLANDPKKSVLLVIDDKHNEFVLKIMKKKRLGNVDWDIIF